MSELFCTAMYGTIAGLHLFFFWGLVQVFPQANPQPKIQILWSQVQQQAKQQGVNLGTPTQQPSQPNSQPSESPTDSNPNSSNNSSPNNPPPQPTSNGQPIINQDRLTTQPQSPEKSAQPSDTRQFSRYSF